VVGFAPSSVAKHTSVLERLHHAGEYRLDDPILWDTFVAMYGEMEPSEVKTKDWWLDLLKRKAARPVLKSNFESNLTSLIFPALKDALQCDGWGSDWRIVMSEQSVLDDVGPPIKEPRSAASASDLAGTEERVCHAKLDALCMIFKIRSGPFVPFAFIEAKRKGTSVKDAMQQMMVEAIYISNQSNDVKPPLLGMLMSCTPGEPSVKLIVFNRRQRKMVQYVVGDLKLTDNDGFARLARVLNMWARRIANRVDKSLSSRAVMSDMPVISPRVVLPRQRGLYDGDSKAATVLKFVRTDGPAPFIEPYATYLHAKVVAKSSGTWLLEYPFVHGSHSPNQIGDFIPIVKLLAEMHEQKIVHGDVRLANMIFSGDKSLLIDFDMSGKLDPENPPLYPKGYQRVDDTERHADAKQCQPILPAHDMFSLGSVMAFFTASSNSKEWTDACNFVKNGIPSEALRVMGNISQCLLNSEAAPRVRGTGSPVRKFEEN